MLQISTGKFFKGEAHETVRRAVYYTNYRVFREDVLIETQAGSLQPVIGTHGLKAFTCEIIERIEKLPGGPYSGEMAATSGDTLINDFAAIVSFALNVTCTNDLDLARRLVTNERPSLGSDLLPQKYVPRMFDRTVDCKPEDTESLQRFVSHLMALERKSYEGALRAIRHYVLGAHRISDDANLAYALFVMSIESLAQKFDRFEPTWDDYDQKKRRAINAALEDATEPVADKVRTAILANEHVALARRFREFVLAHVGPGFFREEAQTAVSAISRPDLSIALKQAYTIRSSYVHDLKEIPRHLVGIPGYHETVPVDGQPALTFAGLARVARHVIKTFVERAPKAKTEDFAWRKDLPGLLTMQLASQCWISNSQEFNVDTAQQYLIAFVEQIANVLLNPSAVLTDIRPVLAKVEVLVPSLTKPSQRLPMLALYFLFNNNAPEGLRSAKFPKFLDSYLSDFESPSIISMVAHLLTNQIPGWSLQEMERLFECYFRERHHSNIFKLGQVLEAAFALILAEQNRAAGHLARARELIAFAVETCPTHVNLRNFEALSQKDDLAPICWHEVLLPAVSASE